MLFSHPILNFNFCFLSSGETSKAAAIWQQLVKLEHRLEDAAVFLINMYAKEQKLNQAKEIFALFSDNGGVSVALHNAMVDVFSKCGKSDDAYQLYNGQVEKGHELGAVSTSIIVNSLTRHGEYDIFVFNHSIPRSYYKTCTIFS